MTFGGVSMKTMRVGRVLLVAILFVNLAAAGFSDVPAYDQSKYQFSLPVVLERSVPRRADADRGWIQKAIDGRAAQGGGTVVVPPGVHNIGTIWLRSGVELHLEKGAVLNGSARQEDYDQFPRKDCPITPEFSDKALICAANAEDIAITGEGVIDGNGPAFYDTSKFVRGTSPFWRVPDLPRPRLVQFANCRRIRLSGVTFRDAAAFTMYVRGCEDFTVGHVAVVGDRRITNNDGIHMDGCRRVRIGDSSVNTGDDCIVLRAIRTRTDPERPVVCEDVVVSNCTLSSACQAIRIGCPSDDTIRNVVFRDIDMTGSRNGIYFGNHLYCVREADEGFLDATDILFENFRGVLTGRPIQILVDDGIKLRRIDRVTFRNVDVRGTGTRYWTTIRSPFGSVRYENVTINGKRQPDGQVPVSKVSDAPFVRAPALTWDNLN